MAVARSDDGSGNLTRRRLPRKPGGRGRRHRRPSTPSAPAAAMPRPLTVARTAPRRPLPDADAEAVRPGRARGHRRTHRHEPRPANCWRSTPAGGTRRSGPRRRHVGSAARRLRLPPQRRPQLPRLAGRHLRLAEPDSPPRPAHRPGRRRADPPADRGPGKLRPDAGRSGQRPSAGREDTADRLRGPDAAAPQPTPRAGDHPRGAGVPRGRPRHRRSARASGR